MRPQNAETVHLVKMFMASFASTLVWTAMIVYQIQVVGLLPLQLVLLGTTMEISILLFEVPTGVVADMVSRRLSSIIGYFLLGAGFLVQGLVPSFEVLVLGNIIWGLGFTFTSGAYDAWLVDEVGQARAAHAFLRGSQIARVAGMLGLLTAMVLGSINLTACILLGGAMTLVVAVYLWVAMPETGFTPAAPDERSTWQRFWGIFREGIAIIRQRPQLFNIIGIGLVFGLFSEVFDRLWQAHLIENIGLPFATIQPIVYVGLINLVVDGLSIGTSELVRRRVAGSPKHLVSRFFLLFTAVMVVGELVFALSHGAFVLAIVAIIAFKIARGQNETLYAIWSNQHIDSSVRATVLSLQSQTDAIGQIGGGIPLGLIGQRSITLALLASTGVLSWALPLIVRGSRLQNDANKP